MKKLFRLKKIFQFLSKFFVLINCLYKKLKYWMSKKNFTLDPVLRPVKILDYLLLKYY